MAIKKYLNLVKVNVFILLAILLCMEIIFHAVFLVKNKYFLFDDPNKQAREQTFRAHPYLSIALNKNVTTRFKLGDEYKTLKTTDIGTRWTNADLSDTSKIRIACIGGSTTFCTGVRDEDSWPAMLQKKLGKNFAVVNYGVPAYTTVEGIIQMALYVPELKPDIIIFLQGWNDMYNYYIQDSYPDYYTHGEVLMPVALLGRKKNESAFEKFSGCSSVFYYSKSIGSRMFKADSLKYYTVPDPSIDRLYLRNLKTLSALAHAQQARAVFISQILNPDASLRKTFPWSIRVQKELIPGMMDHFNGITEEVCKANSNNTYLDFSNSIKWEPHHFWDELHFTKQGNEVFSKMLYQKILILANHGA